MTYSLLPFHLGALLAQELPAGLLPEERDCLTDATRYSEAIDMVDNWEAFGQISGYTRSEVADWLTQRELQRTGEL